MSTYDADTDAIRETWLQVCGPCDAGLPGECSHPDEDYRPTMLALVTEVDRLRGLNLPGAVTA
jgi:hypothetical protein